MTNVPPMTKEDSAFFCPSPLAGEGGEQACEAGAASRVRGRSRTKRGSLLTRPRSAASLSRQGSGRKTSAVFAFVIGGALVGHSSLPAAPLGEEFDDLGQDLLAVHAVEGERELGGEEPVLQPDVVPLARDLEGQIALAAGEFG